MRTSVVIVLATAALLAQSVVQAQSPPVPQPFSDSGMQVFPTPDLRLHVERTNDPDTPPTGPEAWLSARAQDEIGQSDVLRSALVGAGLGAVLGGVGFAAVTYHANEGSDRAYWPLALITGGAAGGAAGAIAGGVYGAMR